MVKIYGITFADVQVRANEGNVWAHIHDLWYEPKVVNQRKNRNFLNLRAVRRKQLSLLIRRETTPFRLSKQRKLGQLERMQSTTGALLPN